MLPKPLYLLWFEHIQPPLADTLGIKIAFRRRHTDVPSNFCDFNGFWVLLGGPGVDPRTTFLFTFSTLPLSGDPWRAQGRQKTPTSPKLC